MAEKQTAKGKKKVIPAKGGGVKGTAKKPEKTPEPEEPKVDETNVAEPEEVSVANKEEKEGILGFNYDQEILPFEQIEKHDKFPNCRQTYPGIDELAKSILEQGLESPMTVWEFVLDAPVNMPWGMVDKRYFLIAGFRRHQAISMLQVEHPEYLVDVPVHVFRGTLQEAIFVNLTENIQRENPNAVEIGAIFHSLVKDHGMLQVDVAGRLGVSESYVSMILGFYNGKNIAPQLREMVASNQINVWMAMKIGTKKVEQQIRIVERLKDAFKDGTGEETVKKIKDELNKGKPAPKKKIRSFKEVQERFDKALVADMNNMSTEDQVHMSGILKAMYWMLNEDVDWDDKTLYGWGLPDNVIAEAQTREGRRTKKKKSS